MNLVTALRAGGVSALLLACILTNAGCQRSLLAVRESGDAHYARGEYAQAEADYLEYIDRSPARPEVHQMLGNTYLATGKTGLAREHLLLANTLRLEDDKIFGDTCEALFADKKFDELNRLLKARCVDRGRMQDYMLLAKFAARQGDKDETQRALLTAAKVDGGMRFEPQFELAKLYASIGDKQQAIERGRMAYFCDPQNGEVQALLTELGQIPGPALGVVPTERTE
ncbi:MAG: hypothetical protein IT438_01750 [Phycisphaerales bacterium]|nr:hypothetical protein [Phycisphaerales bacterium]